MDRVRESETLRIQLIKKWGLWGLFLLLPLVPLVFFFTGPISPAANIDGPALSMPAGARITVDTSSIPDWWRRFDLRIRCQEAQDCSTLEILGLSSPAVVFRPCTRKSEIVFRLSLAGPPPPKIYLTNNRREPLSIEQMVFRNFSAISTGFPKFALLLSPFPGPLYPLLPTILLIAGTLLLILSGLFLISRRPQTWSKFFLLWLQGTIPWLVLILTLWLRLTGRHLLLSGEILPLLSLPGWFYFVLTASFFRGKFLSLLIAASMGLSVIILLATVLGFGIPVKNFGPSYIYQTHFTRTAIYCGLIYLFLSIFLYRQKKAWFSPGKRLCLSSLIIVFFPALIIYLSNGFSGYGGDTLFNSLLSWRILLGEGLRFSKEFAAAHGTWGLLPIRDSYLPTFPMGPGFLGLPTALLQYFFSTEPVELLIGWNQKVTATWMAALSAALFFQAVFLLGRNTGLSLLLTAAFALGSTQPTISAAVLWQHGPTVFLLCWGLLFIIKGQQESPSWYPLAGLPLAFLPIMRPQALLFYLAGMATVGILQPKSLLRFLLWSLPGITAALWINLGLYHSLVGGYGYMASGENFSTPFFEGAAGLLFSPNRGALVFSPFLILGIVGGGILWLKRSVWAWCFGLAALFFFIIHAKYVHWHGGWCVAPRSFSELVPLLTLFSVYWFLEIKKAVIRVIGVVLVLISISINLPGAFYVFEQGQWNMFPNVDLRRQERIWDYRDWLPFHFLYWVDIEKFRETPAFPFVVGDTAEPVTSERYHNRVKTILTSEPQEVLRISNLALNEGAYRIIYNGKASSSTSGRAQSILGFVGNKVEETLLPLAESKAFPLMHDFVVEKKGRLDFRLLISGQGSVIFDTIRIIPLQK
ncbi:MAG: hypothetical protein AB1585_12660 [Thermodesulfobacteriota bacterium]